MNNETHEITQKDDSQLFSIQFRNASYEHPLFFYIYVQAITLVLNVIFKLLLHLCLIKYFDTGN